MVVSWTYNSTEMKFAHKYDGSTEMNRQPNDATIAAQRQILLMKHEG
jgi:hypothetical protein